MLGTQKTTNHFGFPGMSTVLTENVPHPRKLQSKKIRTINATYMISRSTPRKKIGSIIWSFPAGVAGLAGTHRRYLKM